MGTVLRSSALSTNSRVGSEVGVSDRVHRKISGIGRG